MVAGTDGDLRGAQFSRLRWLFCIDEFYKQKICPDRIVNGAEIPSMSVDDLKFIDSIGFTKAFGLRELRRDFPLNFSTQWKIKITWVRFHPKIIMTRKECRSLDKRHKE